MGKLGKKARKFAKKNLQSVLRNRRKTKSLFKKRSSKVKQDSVEDEVEKNKALGNGRSLEGEEFKDISLDEIFTEDETDVAEDASDSDGFLTEELSYPGVVGSENDHNLKDNGSIMSFSVHNSKVYEELTLQKKKLDRLKKKDPEFAKFLASYQKGHEMSRDEEMDSDDDEASNHGMQLVDEDSNVMHLGKLLTNSMVNSWCQLLKEQHNEPALIHALNGYRAACHYGTESTGMSDTASCPRLENSEAFCNILIFMLREADNIFCNLLKIPSSSCKKEVILELKNTSRWKSLRPLIKSYLRSTLFLLNQVTDSELLAFSLSRLRASVIFFAAFPSLLHRLIKVTVHFWATGEGVLSSYSFLIIRDVAVVFSSEFFDICLVKTYKAYIAHSKVVQFVSTKHIQFLRNSFVELCSLDVRRSCAKALLSIEQLARILKQGIRTKKKEALKKICGWEYTNCIDLWVMFVSANGRDFDFNHVFYLIIQLINGVACLFPGPRYFPLRSKCVQWLNHLSSSSGIFIPVVSLVLDVLDYKSKDSGNSGKTFNFSSVLKLPKHWLKSRSFQEECVFFAVEQLSKHFYQWSYHISFPDLAVVPLIRLRKFLETENNESLKRIVKRLIDQAEQNVEFVRKKRDDVAFSPKDHQLVESFLQLEKGSNNAPFTQYYRSVMQKAASRNLETNGIRSSPEHKTTKRKRGQLQSKLVNVGVNTKRDSEETAVC